MPRTAAIPRNTRPARREDQTALLTLFILSPTAGTVVAAWRGVKLLILRYRERLLLEARAIGLRSRGYVQLHRRCPECGFGALRVLGDHPFRPRARTADPHATHPQPSHPHARFGPHDLRCDRPGCHHLAHRQAA